jgi:hypothetical protein
MMKTQRVIGEQQLLKPAQNHLSLPGYFPLDKNKNWGNARAVLPFSPSRIIPRNKESGKKDLLPLAVTITY